MSKILLILLLSLIPLKAKGQEYLSTNKFHWEIRRGVVIVEFWSGWNRGNEILFLPELTNCKAYRYVVNRDRTMLDEYKVTATPTLIVFKNGEERFRYSPNIMLKVTATREQVQSAINEL